MKNSLFDVDWARLFMPDVPLLETVVRGSVIFLGIFFLLSIARNREAGPLSVNNVLVLVLLAASAHSALAGGSHSVTNALLLVVTIAGWSYALDWIGYRSPRFRRLVRPDPLPLIVDGRPVDRNLARESITRDELLAQLRLQGIEDISDVKRACLEPDGQVSVIKREAGSEQATQPPRRRRSQL